MVDKALGTGGRKSDKDLKIRVKSAKAAPPLVIRKTTQISTPAAKAMWAHSRCS